MDKYCVSNKSFLELTYLLFKCYKKKIKQTKLTPVMQHLLLFLKLIAQFYDSFNHNGAIFSLSRTQ